MIHRRALFAAAPATILAGTARAQDSWPTRPVSIVVPFVAGGPSDIVARIIALRMGMTVGQPVVAENRPGANGEVAARAVARAAPDGHTLLVGSIGVFAINAALRPNLGYDPVREFSPITLAVTTPNVLVVNPQRVPATTLPELVAWLKANAGRTSYSTSGVGSSDHLTMELFKQVTGTDPTHVPYGGGAAAATDLIAGNVQLSFQNLGTVAGHIQGGRLKAIAVTGSQRNALTPDIPTFAELKQNGVDATTWHGYWAPAGTPRPIVDKLGDVLARTAHSPDVVTKIQAMGGRVVGSRPEEFGAFCVSEKERFAALMMRSGIEPE